MKKTVAVILSGCGYLDGAEIRESVLSLLALDRLDVDYNIYAPDLDQFHVIDHKTTNEVSHKRNVLQEAARIARGEVQPLSKLEATNYDALVLPGGFGVAKNLSKLAFKGAEAEIHPHFDKLLKEFHSQSKPIAAICISPAVICLSLGNLGPEVTIGHDQETSDVIEKLGGKHIDCKANEFHIDSKNKIVSTPAYMYDNARISDISNGINGCIKAALELC